MALQASKKNNSKQPFELLIITKPGTGVMVDGQNVQRGEKIKPEKVDLCYYLVGSKRAIKAGTEKAKKLEAEIKKEKTAIKKEATERGMISKEETKKLEKKLVSASKRADEAEAKAAELSKKLEALEE